jgi:hypothetical protein
MAVRVFSFARRLKKTPASGAIRQAGAVFLTPLLAAPAFLLLSAFIPSIIFWM